MAILISTLAKEFLRAIGQQILKSDQKLVSKLKKALERRKRLAKRDSLVVGLLLLFGKGKKIVA